MASGAASLRTNPIGARWKFLGFHARNDLVILGGGLIPGPGEQAVWARPDRGMWRDRVLTAERDEEAAES